MQLLGGRLLLDKLVLAVWLLQHCQVSAFLFQSRSFGRRYHKRRQQSVTSPGRLGWCLGRQHKSSVILRSSDSTFVEADDVEAIKAMFANYADESSLMGKVDVMGIPYISELLSDGDLLVEEFNELWEKSSTKGGSMDAESFVQFYRAIDDLFEDDEEDVDETDVEVEPVEAKLKEPVSVATTSSSSNTDGAMGSFFDDDAEIRAELGGIFDVIAAPDGLLTKSTLREWDEVDSLISEAMLDEDEFDNLWKSAPKSSDAGDRMNLDGFITFNAALDDLFEFEDEDGEEEAEDEPTVSSAAVTDTSVDKMEPLVPETELVEAIEDDEEDIFSTLSSDSMVVTKKDLEKWDELNEMLADGDILAKEVEDFYAEALASSSQSTGLDKKSFAAFQGSIDDLFEEIDDEEEEDEVEQIAPPAAVSKVEPELKAPAAVPESLFKTDLLRALDLMNADEERLPCGLESTDREEKLVLGLVGELEQEDSNLIWERKGNIEKSDLEGTWELLFSSSSAMKFNKGLSGLGGSFPNGKFGGLKQKFISTRILTDVEYTEFIDVNPSTASFDVTVNGSWDLSKSISLFTGQPSVVVQIEPDRVSYGPTSTRADHWKSLGPHNMLDLTYLDADLRIMRGNTAVDNVFIYRRLP